jgi:hypothetical protein
MDFPVSVARDAGGETSAREIGARDEDGGSSGDAAAPPIPDDDASLRALVLTMLATHAGNISDVSHVDREGERDRRDRPRAYRGALIHPLASA